MKMRILMFAALAFLIVSCGEKQVKEDVKAEPTEATANTTEVIDPMQDKGIGPITSVTLGDIDDALVSKGKEIFKAKCTACHKIGKRFVGPALKGVTKRQSSEWIMNMILNPEVMVKENKTAKKLLEKFTAPMANQGLTKEEARAVLEMLRTKN